jgi:hypothetical protein
MKSIEKAFMAIKFTIAIVLSLLLITTIVLGKPVRELLDIDMWTMIILIELYIWRVRTEMDSKN